jgi:hypothetical protein
VKRLLKPSLTTIGTAVVLVAGGSVWAYAGWISRTTSQTFTVRAVRIPQMPRPTVAVTVVPVIRWQPVQIPPTTPVREYVVSRHGAGPTQVVCTRPTPVVRCLDLTAPPGSTVTYTVRATYGSHWVGQDSEPSASVTMPGLPLPPGASGAPRLPYSSLGPEPRASADVGVDGAPAVDLPYAIPDAAPATSAAVPSPTPSAPATTAPSATATTSPTAQTESTVTPSPSVRTGTAAP